MKPYYKDGSVTIYHGDCREVLASLSADAVLTDPPYGIGANSMTLGSRPKWRRLDRGDRDWDSETPDLTPILDLAVPTIVWGGNHFPLPVSRGWLVWDKQNGATNYADCELAWTNLDKPIRRMVHRWMGSSAHEKSEGKRWHPTQKPVPVMVWCLGFLPADAVVLDPYMGSGSTLVAAKQIGRRAIGVEIEERYCHDAASRLSQDTLGLVGRNDGYWSGVHDGQHKSVKVAIRGVLEAELLGRRFGNGVARQDIDRITDRLFDAECPECHGAIGGDHHHRDTPDGDEAVRR